jgi:hypothetical protein
VRTPVGWTLAALALVAVVIGAVVIGGRAVSSSADPATSGAECTVPVVPGALLGTAEATAVPVDLDAVQLQHASTINAVGMSRALPVRARVIALATAFQESQLRNLPDGDRDSLGLFQQRPSQGWGTVKQISDPVYAAGKFYDALMKVDGWQQMSLTKAAQAVQYSAFPDAYAKWEGEALTLAAALGGGSPVQLSCRAGAQPPTADAPARRALDGTGAAPDRLKAVLAAAQAEFGGANGQGGLKLVDITDSTAAVTIGLRGVSATAAGRALAAWSVAHSAGFGVVAVAVKDRNWVDHHWSAAVVTSPPGRVTISTS